MMSSPARRIVVAVGLAVVFGTGVSMIVGPAKPGTQNQAARGAAAAAALGDQPASGAPAPGTPAPDLTTPSASAAARDAATAPATPPAVAPPAPAAASAPSSDTTAPKPRTGTTAAAQARNAHAGSVRVASTASGFKSGAPPANDALASRDVTRAEGVSAGSAESEAASEGSAAGSAGEVDMDGQITAQVRSLVANLAPGGNIDVKSTSGIVALTGSVPSQDVAEQARQAAQQVAGVKQVDTSALLVANR